MTPESKEAAMDKYEGLRGYKSGDQWADDAIAALLNEREQLREALQACIDAGYWDTAGRNAHDKARRALAASEPSAPCPGALDCLGCKDCEPSK